MFGFLWLFAFAGFAAGLWTRLRDAEGASTIATTIVAVGAGAFIALGMTEHVLSDVVGVTLHFSKGYTLHHGSTATAASGVIILRTRTLPVWLAWLGIAIAVLCLPTIPFLTFIATIGLAVWAVVISAFLIRADAPAITAA